MTWDYPSLTWADPWEVLGPPPAGIRLVTGITADNPVLLLNRVLKLSAKYHLDMAADPYLNALVAQLAARAASWAPDHDFHGRYAHDALLAPLAVALRRSPALADSLAARAVALGRDEFWAYTDTIVDASPSWRDYRPAP